MIEYKQKFYHKPEEKEYGDCFRTCIACVLNLPIDSVPHLYPECWHLEESERTVYVRDNTNKWLESLNLIFVETPISADLDQLKVYLNHYYKDMNIIIGCNSKNGGHSVVMMNDDYMWDPSKDNSGCVGPMIDGYFWIGLFLSTTMR